MRKNFFTGFFFFNLPTGSTKIFANDNPDVAEEIVTMVTKFILN